MTKRTRKARARGLAGTCAAPGMYVGDHPVRCDLPPHDDGDHRVTITRRMLRESTVLADWVAAQEQHTGTAPVELTWAPELLTPERAAAVTAAATPTALPADPTERLAAIVERLAGYAVLAPGSGVAEAMAAGTLPDLAAAGTVDLDALLDEHPDLRAELEALAADARAAGASTV